MSTDGLRPVPDDLELGATIRGFVAGQRLFDRYVLQQMLGRGGMGVVWLGHDEKLEQEIALKFLPEIVRLDASALDELKRETRRSRLLTHPHVVRIHDFVDDATAAAISMEYVNGATLSALRVQQPSRILEPEQIAEWLRQLCEALYYAHHKVKIVHRDLKPANLMINAEGDLKVTDFGIARSISDSVSRVTMNRAGTSGTLAYMSPQQAMGQAPAVSDDIYSLGATIYELLTSKPPFYRGDILAQVREVMPASIAQCRAEAGLHGAPIPEEWEATVAACMAKRPEDRPQDVAEVVQRMGLGTVSAISAANLRARSIPPPPPVAIQLPPVPVTKIVTPPTVWATAPVIIEPPDKSHRMLLAIIGLLLVGGACFAWYFGVEQPGEKEKLRQVEIAQQEAIQKEKELEAQATADAAEKARLQAEAQKAADEAAQLKTEAEKAKQAADDAAAAKVLADKQAADRQAAITSETPITADTSIDELQRRVDAGEANAEDWLGYDYLNGKNVSADYQQALTLYQKAAAQGDINALNQMGFMYLNGKGVAKDYQQAQAFFQKGVDKGNASAEENLASMYEAGQGMPVDYQQALSLYQKSAEQGCVDAQNCLGSMYLNGRGVTKDYQQALTWYQKGAEKGNSTSQYYVGSMYINGQGVAKDYQQALYWFQKSADQGLAGSQSYIGSMYLNGEGVAKDYQQALSWFQKAADQNLPGAQGFLGLMYLNGQGVAKDYDQAVSWFQKASDQNYAPGETNLAYMYLNGYGVGKSQSTAMELYRKAAAQGEPSAVQTLKNYGLTP